MKVQKNFSGQIPVKTLVKPVFRPKSVNYLGLEIPGLEKVPNTRRIINKALERVLTRLGLQ